MFFLKKNINISTEINQVTLIGTVSRDQFKNDYGRKLIRVKTIESDSKKQ